jgi:hypothetical protein
MDSLRQWIDGFVDDTSLFTNINRGFGNTNDIIELTNRLKQDMMAWKDLLETSGGKLEFKKCFYYILSWKFDRKGNPIPMTTAEQREVAEQIHIPDGQFGIRIALEQKEVITEHKMLGCFKSITGNAKEEIKYLKTNSDILGNRIARAQLTHYQVYLAYNIVYLPSLKYGLPSTSLSFQQIDDIHWFEVDKVLSGMGYDRSTPSALIYGPAEFGGFGIRHLYTEMLGMKFNTVISHLRVNTQFGKAFRISLNYLQLTARITEPILECRTQLPYINSNWIMHLRQVLNEINGCLEINNIWLPKLQCSQDIPLMKAFLTKTTIRADLKVLNNWRLYFKVIFFSEICFPSGIAIQPQYLTYNHDLSCTQSTSNLIWPNQGKPNETSFSIWRKYIKLCFINPSNGRIPPLGKWDLEAVLSSSPLKCYFNTSEHAIYIQQPAAGYNMYPAIFNCREQVNIPRHQAHRQVRTLPQDSIPTDLHLTNNQFLIDL